MPSSLPGSISPTFYVQLLNAQIPKAQTDTGDLTREHWTGEVSADKQVPVFPVILLAIGILKKIFCLYKNDLF